MLTREVMGLFALGVLWLNTLLVAGAALVRARELGARKRALPELDPGTTGRYGLVRGRLIAPQDGGAVATSSIEQVGRHAAGGRRAILWHDRQRRSEIRGGHLELGGSRVAIAPTSGALAEVWLDDATLEAEAQCTGASAFDELYPTAKKARGVTRVVASSLRAGEEVWVAGRITGEGEALLGAGGLDEPLIVSSIDPRVWLGRKILMLVAFAPATLVGAALCTAVALWPPVFDGAVSKVGGLLAFVYFLLVLPAGTRARDAAVEPPRRLLRGRWNDPAAGASRAPSSSRAG